MSLLLSTTLSAYVILLNSALAAAWSILLERQNVNYQHGSALMRYPLWLVSGVFIFRGSALLFATHTTHPDYLSVWGLLSNSALSVFFGCAVASVLMGRAPARYWDSITRIQKLARCRNVAVAMGALNVAIIVAARAMGMKASGPGESGFPHT